MPLAAVEHPQPIGDTGKLGPEGGFINRIIQSQRNIVVAGRLYRPRPFTLAEAGCLSASLRRIVMRYRGGKAR